MAIAINLYRSNIGFVTRTHDESGWHTNISEGTEQDTCAQGFVAQLAWNVRWSEQQDIFIYEETTGRGSKEKD